MAFSKETKTQINQVLIQPSNDFYPDRSATDLSITGDATLRLPFSKFPRTTEDVHDVFTWKAGDTIPSSSFAKNSEYFKEYKKDIDKALSEKGNYKDLYIDTFKPIGDQLTGKE